VDKQIIVITEQWFVLNSKDKHNKDVYNYLIYYARYVSGITFIEYARGQMIGNRNDLKVSGSMQPK